MEKHFLYGHTYWAPLGNLLGRCLVIWAHPACVLIWWVLDGLCHLLYWKIACTRFSNVEICVLNSWVFGIFSQVIDIWSSCRATTTSKQSRLKNSCSVHTGLPEVLDSAVGSLHLHGRATFWFTLATTAPRPVFVLFCIFFSQTPKNIEPTSAQVPWLKSDIRWVILSKKSPRNLLIIPTIYNMPSSSQFLH